MIPVDCACVETCETKALIGFACPTACVPGCQCAPGHVQNAAGDCIPETQCPCFDADTQTYHQVGMVQGQVTGPWETIKNTRHIQKGSFPSEGEHRVLCGSRACSYHVGSSRGLVTWVDLRPCFPRQLNSLWRTESSCGSVTACRCGADGPDCATRCDPSLCDATEIAVQDEAGCCHCQSVVVSTTPAARE